jgi:hypothetical protein
VDPLLCGPNSLDPAGAAAIVFCQRGVYDRVAKSAEVLRAGGAGMVLVNKTASSLDLDQHSVRRCTSTPKHSTWPSPSAPPVRRSRSRPATSSTPPTPQVAGFSSRGPVLPTAATS